LFLLVLKTEKSPPAQFQQCIATLQTASISSWLWCCAETADPIAPCCCGPVIQPTADPRATFKQISASIYPTQIPARAPRGAGDVSVTEIAAARRHDASAAVFVHNMPTTDVRAPREALSLQAADRPERRGGSNSGVPA